MKNLTSVLILVSVTFMAVGSTCGCNTGKTQPVSGTVTYNGIPVEMGSISFISDDPDIAPVGGVIEQGKFSFTASVGKNRVEIFGSRPLPPERQDSPGAILYEDYIPAEFNTASTLSIEVNSSTTVFPFNLSGP